MTLHVKTIRDNIISKLSYKDMVWGSTCQSFEVEETRRKYIFSSLQEEIIRNIGEKYHLLDG